MWNKAFSLLTRLSHINHRSRSWFRPCVLYRPRPSWSNNGFRSSTVVSGIFPHRIQNRLRLFVAKHPHSLLHHHHLWLQGFHLLLHICQCHTDVVAVFLWLCVRWKHHHFPFQRLFHESQILTHWAFEISARWLFVPSSCIAYLGFRSDSSMKRDEAKNIKLKSEFLKQWHLQNRM